MAKLAIDADTPERPSLFASWPQFSGDEIDAVGAVLRSGCVNYWTGEQGRQFEAEFAKYCGAKKGIALANGTVALELALKGFGIEPGDEVIVPPRTFIATASSVALSGGTPVFADVDTDSQNITAETIRQQITPKTKAVIVVHLAGWPCDMEPIMALAREHRLKVIEDCAQAHGARYQGKPVGGFGDAAAFSFCQDKIMTTGGEGGMLLTSDESLWGRSWAYKDHGKSYGLLYQPDSQNDAMFSWVHESFGTNWRMTEMQSAIGRIQLGKLDQWVAQRKANAEVLIDRFSRHKALRTPVPGQGVNHAYYKFYAFIRPEYLKSGWDQSRLIDAINAEGAPCFYGSCSEVYLEKAFTNAGLGQKKRLPVAKQLGETSLMFLVHPTLSSDDMHRMSDAVDKVLREAAVQ